MEFWMFVVVGFLAQLVDGSLGMAYGVTASSLLMSLGIPPAASSACVHTAECFTTGASALSHRAFGNIDKTLFRKLLIPGILGAILGATILSSSPGEKIKPYIALYLSILGIIIMLRAIKMTIRQRSTTPLGILGFFGALVDAIGGGGWGPIVASTLVARGNEVRMTVGSVNAVEFFITLASATTFFVTMKLAHVDIIIALALGGILAAPLAAWAAKHIPTRPFMFAVGLLVTVISIRNGLTVFF